MPSDRIGPPSDSEDWHPSWTVDGGSRVPKGTWGIEPPFISFEDITPGALGRLTMYVGVGEIGPALRDWFGDDRPSRLIAVAWFRALAEELTDDE